MDGKLVTVDLRRYMRHEDWAEKVKEPGRD
jgi:hypothetical protein